MWTLGTPALEIVMRAGLIYLAFLAGLRLFGKLEVGQFTLFDLALVLLASNALQPAMTGPDQSVAGGHPGDDRRPEPSYRAVARAERVDPRIPGVRAPGARARFGGADEARDARGRRLDQHRGRGRR